MKKNRAIITDYIGNIKLMYSEKNQLLIASQNYGTFYCVFGKFNIDKNKITSVSLELINYKGLINIGFLNGNGLGCTITRGKSTIIKTPDPDTLYIELRIKALEPDYKTHIEVKSPIDINGLKRIHVLRQIKPLHDRGEANKNGVFDNEFYYRSGVNELEKRETRNGHYVKNKGSIIGPEGGGSGKCWESILEIVD